MCLHLLGRDLTRLDEHLGEGRGLRPRAGELLGHVVEARLIIEVSRQAVLDLLLERHVEQRVSLGGGDLRQLWERVCRPFTRQFSGLDRSSRGN